MGKKHLWQISGGVEQQPMPEVTFRFYEELNDFLPPEKRKRDFQSPFKGRESIKDKIEALGVPHTEVDLILVNGDSVDFGYILQDGDRISVYPVFESLDIQNAEQPERGTPQTDAVRGRLEPGKGGQNPAGIRP